MSEARRLKGVFSSSQLHCVVLLSKHFYALALNHRSVFADSVFLLNLLSSFSSSSFFPLPLLHHLSSHLLAPPPLYFWLPCAGICVGDYGWLCCPWRAMCHQIDFHLSEAPWNVSAEYRWMDGWELEVWWENLSQRTQKSQASLACDGPPNENGIPLMEPYEASFIAVVMTLVFFKCISAVNVYEYYHSLKQ